jgi:glycosyltransferase involved in cell wall biosynthesis
MKVSIITTCKGRLHHLKEVLPTWLEQQGKTTYEIIVVDYADPDGSYDYVASLDNPKVKAIKATDCGDYFNLSRARNIGALEARGDILFFLDADAYLEPKFLHYHVSKVLVDGSYVTGWGYGDGTGCCLVWKRDFLAVRGYNEVVDGWGFDDIDFYYRLDQKFSIDHRKFSFGLTTIKHSDDERVSFYRNGNLSRSNALNEQKTKRRFVSCIQ